MAEFVTGVEGIDALTLEEEALEALEVRFEGWRPAEGHPLFWATKAFSRIGALLYGQLGLTLTAQFKRFGESLIGVPPIQAAPAYVESIWTMVDDAGYTIPAGTQVKIAAAGDTVVGFRTVEAVTVAPESTTAAVTLVAIEPGSQGNELSANPVLSDSLAFVASIALEGTTANGVDEEDEDVYLARLVEETQTLSRSLIVGRDFEINARGVPAVHRAKAVEAYRADEGKEAALHVSVYPIDIANQDLSTPTKEALKARQEAMVPSGIKVHVADPNRVPVAVKAKVAVKPGFDPAATLAAVEARLNEYFETWGTPDFGDPASTGGWVNKLVVRHLELVAETDRVGGVDYVAELKLAEEGDPLGTADITMPGPVALAEAGTIEVEAV